MRLIPLEVISKELFQGTFLKSLDSAKGPDSLGYRDIVSIHFEAGRAPGS